MPGRNVKVTIDGTNVEVDVEGVRGKECMTLTEFLRKAPGVKVETELLKRAYSDLEVPTEVKI